MTRLPKVLSGSGYLGAVAVVAATGLAIPQAHAGKLKPPPAAVVCPCGNVVFQDSTVVGNIEVADSGGFTAMPGPGTVTGTVEFAAGNTGQYNLDDSDVVVSGGPTYGAGNVTTDVSTLTTASSTFSAETGAALVLASGGTVTASSGIPDGTGNEIFTATIDPSFVAGTTFTINGDGSENVVVNIPDIDSAAIAFDGSIILTGGLTPGEVLFNFGSGGPLTIDNGQTPTAGLYMDINEGSILVDDSVIDGAVYGGDDLGITDSTIIYPTPEPASLSLLGAGLIALGVIRRRRRAPISRP